MHVLIGVKFQYVNLQYNHSNTQVGHTHRYHLKTQLSLDTYLQYLICQVSFQSCQNLFQLQFLRECLLNHQAHLKTLSQRVLMLFWF